MNLSRRAAAAIRTDAGRTFIWAEVVVVIIHAIASERIRWNRERCMEEGHEWIRFDHIFICGRCCEHRPVKKPEGAFSYEENPEWVRRQEREKYGVTSGDYIRVIRNRWDLPRDFCYTKGTIWLVHMVLDTHCYCTRKDNKNAVGHIYHGDYERVEIVEEKKRKPVFEQLELFDVEAV